MRVSAIVVGLTLLASACASRTEKASAPALPSIPPKVLIFTYSNSNYRHASIEPASEVLRGALAARGVTVEIGADPGVFTVTRLSDFAGIVLVSSSGTPLGDPGTEAMEALVAWVRRGGGLVSIHAATAVRYDETSTFVQLLGGKFAGHPGDTRDATCQGEGAHPSVQSLPSPLATRDEIYAFTALRADNRIDVRCSGFEGRPAMPVAWHRDEGAGRVFNTALGHGAELWALDGPLVKSHVVPGILWAMRR